jgi:hypothetical protein
LIPSFRRQLAVVLGLVMLVLSQEVMAQDVSEPASPSTHRSAEVVLPDGSLVTLTLDAVNDGVSLAFGTTARTLPFRFPDVLGFGFLDPGVAASVDQRPGAILDVLGARTESEFLPETVEVVEATPPEPHRHPGAPEPYVTLLPGLKVETYSDTDRARLAKDTRSGIVLTCGPGQDASGILLTGLLQGLDAAHPGGLRVRIRGAGEFELLVSDQAHLKAEEPVPVGSITATPQWSEHDLLLPAAGWHADDLRGVTIACPDVRGTLELASLELILADRVAEPAAPAVWVWAPERWQTQARDLLEHLKSVGAHELFVTVPLVDERCVPGSCAVANAELLARFLVQAQLAGIRVWAVSGDPQAMLAEDRPAWLGRAAAYAEFNRSEPVGARLAGVQYDIEPYLLPGYKLAPQTWNRAWLDLLGQLHAAGAGLPVDVVVPWWFGQVADSPPSLLDALVPLVERLTVMDYRTEQDAVVRAAIPFLEWGRRHDRKVRIALEAGPLAEEEVRRYAPAPSGELWLGVVGGHPVYVLLRSPVAATAGGKLFALQGRHAAAAANTSFLGQQDALWHMVQRVDAAFGGVSAYSGVALHGLDAAWY